ncbi:MAG TPA: hypothetical protein VEU33_37555 [Archangium sp.]|nr:hypothetical protein [Archangium sp.]
MVLTREDRRDLGWLGLWVAVYGLAFAPVLHAVYGHGAEVHVSSPAPHDEHPPHSHGPTGEHGKQPQKSAGHTHGTGSVEHLQAVALPSFALPPLRVFWVDVGARHLGQERAQPGEPLRPTAMPQGP